MQQTAGTAARGGTGLCPAASDAGRWALKSNPHHQVFTSSIN